jgi:hypothetical protein
MDSASAHENLDCIDHRYNLPEQGAYQYRIAESLVTGRVCARY